MTKEQKAAVRQLQNALYNCAATGLRGGVFESSFCVWPTGCDPFRQGDFFCEVEACGGHVLPNTHGMNLDGGAGN